MNKRFYRMSVVRWAAPLLTLVAAIVAGTLFGVQLVVLTLAAAALLLVIFLLWSSVQALAGESELTFEEAFSFGARSAEEEQKRSRISSTSAASVRSAKRTITSMRLATVPRPSA